MRRGLATTALTGFVLVVVACSGGGHPAASTPIGAPSDAAVQTYGFGPARDGSAHYRPGVVVIEDGPAAIRSASDDGLTWTIDGNAKGASQLDVGSVMLASSRAAGRVVAMHDEGGNRVVTLAPVQLTDIVESGDIKIDQVLDPSSFVFQEVPDLPGKVSESQAQTPTSTENSQGVVVLPPVELIARS